MKYFLTFLIYIQVILLANAQDELPEVDVLGAAERYGQAQDAYWAENYEDALWLFGEAIKINPYNADYFFGRSQCLYQVKKYQEASSDIEMSIQLESNQPDYHNQAGNIYFRLMNLDKAILNYGLALSNQGNNDVLIDDVKAHYNRGICYLLKKQYDLAIADFTKVIENDDEFAEAYYNRGIAHLKQNRVNSACENFKVALEKGITKAKQHLLKNCGK